MQRVCVVVTASELTGGYRFSFFPAGALGLAMFVHFVKLQGLFVGTYEFPVAGDAPVVLDVEADDDADIGFSLFNYQFRHEVLARASSDLVFGENYDR